MSDSIARSLATATVRPRGSKLACATQLASIAPLALLLAAVMTYSPPDTRANDLATSGAMDAFILAMLSFFVRICASLVPASSMPYQVTKCYVLLRKTRCIYDASCPAALAITCCESTPLFWYTACVPVELFYSEGLHLLHQQHVCQATRGLRFLYWARTL